MKHLKIFASMEEFEAAKPSMDTPFVVLAGNEVVYSNLVEITEDELDTTEYIDLGLPSGLKWASCNLGASKPCDYGLYYQCGFVDGISYNASVDEIDAWNKYDANTDTWKESFPSGKYENDYAAGEVLDPSDDAVYVATKGKAHMPTDADIDELLSNTTNQWCQCTVLGEDHTSHNVYGRLFTSKANDNKIFIPAAGYYHPWSHSFSGVGSDGLVWSASAGGDGSAHYLYFSSGYCLRSLSDRSYGQSVRGVCE